MALQAEVVIKGKLIPSKIALVGDNIDTLVGNIEVDTAIRQVNGAVTNRESTAFDIMSQSGFTDSNGISLPAVANFFSEWFDFTFKAKSTAPTAPEAP